MPRGRHKQPDEIARLKGNPGKRKLDTKPLASVVVPSRLGPADYPGFLTGEREREIFRAIIEDFLPRRLARKSDFPAYGRYAALFALWIRAKENLGENSTWYQSESKHGKMLRRNPAFQDMLDIGKSLERAELQLGLTPLSRQTIMRSMSGMRDLAAGMFPDDHPKSTAPADDAKPDASLVPQQGPLGFLQTATKPH